MKPILMLCVACVLGSAMADASARARYVVVNGQRMNAMQLRQLDQAACTRIPDGRYWMNMRNGYWGYERGPVQGRLGEHCRQRRKSLSERGLLYSPGELLR